MQTILREIQVRRDKLHLSLDGLGSIVVKDYLHTFPTGRIKEERVLELLNELGQNPVLQNCALRGPTELKESFLDIVQVDAPLEVAQARCYSLQQVREYLSQHPIIVNDEGNLQIFSDRMMFYLINHPPEGRPPYHLEAIKRHLYAHPKVEPRHYSIIDNLFDIVRESWSMTIPREKTDKTKSLFIPSPLSSDFHRGSYSKLARWRIAPKGSVVEVEDSLAEEIRSGAREVSLQGRIKYLRQMTAAEIMEKKVCFVDIEKPLFGTDEEEVSWAAVISPAGKTIYSLYPQTAGVEKTRAEKSEVEVNGFKMHCCANEKDLVYRVAQEVKKAEIFVAYNVPFDAIQLREAGEFNVGEDEAEPKKISTIKFFERIGIRGKDVLDLLQWAKVAYSYLPNRKLVMVARHLLGEEAFTKEISYAEQADLEHICRGDNYNSFQTTPRIQEMLQKREAAEINASYVSKDALVLEEMLKTEHFQQSVEDVAFMAQLFTIDSFLLLHDAKRVQDFLERKFFEKAGTFREAIYPHWTVFMKYEQKVKNKLKRTLEKQFPSQEKGLVKDVCQVYLPLGRALRQDCQWFHPELKEFYAYVDSQQVQSQSNPQRLFFLARYEEALAEWMWKDYAAYLYEEGKFLKLAKEYHLDDKEKIKQLQGIFKSHANILKAHGLEEKLNKCAIAQRDFKSLPAPPDEEYLRSTGLGLEFKGFYGLFTQWSRMREKNRILLGAEQADWEHYQLRLQRYCEKVKDYLSEQGLKVVHAHNHFLYVVGEEKKLTSALISPDSPVIPIDKIASAYLSGGRIYYKEHGFFRGFKEEEEEPTYHLNRYEMSAFGEFLDSVLKDHLEEALTGLWSSLDALGSQKVPSRELLWWTKSKQRYHALIDGEKVYFEEEQDFIPDWEMYGEKVQKRALTLIKPLLKKESENFISDALSNEPERQLEHYLSLLGEKQLKLF